MDVDKTLASLLRPLSRTATKLNLARAQGGDLPVTGSHFGGTPYAEAGEEWSVCPKCQTALTFICQVDTASGFHKKPADVALFTFFYCWECSPWGWDEDEGSWVVRTYSEPEEIKAVAMACPGGEPDAPVACAVSAEEVVAFPDWDGLESWSKEASDLCVAQNSDEPWEEYVSAVKALGGLTDFATVVGGYPMWVQGEATPDCEYCESRMNLLAQIDSESEAGIMWGDAGSLYLFYCAEHAKNIKLYLQCF